MTSDADRKSRVEDTKIQGFHQIVALGQNLINTSLWTLWGDEEKEDQLAKFEVTVPDVDIGMTARMGPPTVELFKSIEYADHPPILYFNIHFDSGKFEYYSGFGPKAVKKTCDVGKWKLAFKVDLSLNELAKVPEDVQKKVHVAGKYSINQLLLDFGTPDLIQYDRSKSTITGLSEFDQEYCLDKFMKEYLIGMKKEGKTVLGYAVTVEDPKIANPQAPSFPPTLLKYQTMCYLPPSGVPRTGPSGQDMFMFLEMTGEKPKFPDAPLKMSGNWVTPDVHGTMAICKENFWDNYLLPKISSFNSATLALVNRLKVCAEKEDRLSSDEKFAWSCTDKPRPSDDSLYWTPVANGADFAWQGKLYGGEPQYFSDIKTEVRWSAGSNQIKLKLHVQMEEQKMAFNSVYKSTVYVDREHTITLSSVFNGGLDVHVSEEKPKVRSEGNKRYLFWDFESGQVPERMRKFVEARMLNESLADNIKSALNGQQHFVFPGGGTFAMKDPVFNAEGDLLIGLNYKEGQV